MMWTFLRGGATVIPGATFIPESRVNVVCERPLMNYTFLFAYDSFSDFDNYLWNPIKLHNGFGLLVYYLVLFATYDFYRGVNLKERC